MSSMGYIILGGTLASAVRDGIKAIPKALEVAGKLGGQAFNGVVNLADEGATRGMRMWDQQRQEQLKPPAPPTTEDLGKRTTPLGSGPQTQGFNNESPKTHDQNQTATSPLSDTPPTTHPPTPTT